MKAKSAQRYAQAAIDLLPEEREKMRMELMVFCHCLEHSLDFRHILFRDIFTIEEREKVLEKISQKMKLSLITRNFLFLLVRKNRFRTFFDIMIAIREKLNMLENKAEASICSARELSESLKNRLKDKFEKKLGKKLEITYEVNPILLGGIVTKIGNTIFDGSVQLQLHLLKNQLEKGV